jgi:translocation and assembly module TamA
MRFILAALLIACAASAYAQDDAAPGQDDAPPEQDDASRGKDDPAAARDRTPPARPPLTVTWIVPEPFRALAAKNLPPPRQVERGERRAGSLRPWLRDVRRRIPEMAAAEGYFSATVEVNLNDARDHADVVVNLGPRTTVGSIEMEFTGDLAGEGEAREKRRRELREAWTMKEGQPFRSADWEVAKTRIEETLTEQDYAAGHLAASRAEVDAESSSARLKLTLDSGPTFTLGDVEIIGLERYSEAVVRRLVNLERGERYNRTRLIDQQHLIQNGWWFSSVVVDIDNDPAKTSLVPVRVTVIERAPREVGLSLGYGTDDGARGEAAYRDRNFFGRGFDLQSSVRISEKRQIGYVDIYLPPGLVGTVKRGDVPYKDSVGVLAEHNVIEKLAQSRFAAAGYRHFSVENFELRCGLSYQIERTYPEGSDVNLKKALAPIVATTWRHVDNVFDPKKGGVLALQFAAGAKKLASGDDFFRVYGQYQYWIPLGANDQLVLRTELGRTFAPSREHIPEDFLFRAGGARSNRGYAYQSLGPKEGDAVVGGRYLATASIEYVHWLNERWGAAVFTDVGDASDSVKEWEPLKSYGVGARFRTPAGPLAIDLAYAERDRKFRLAFSVTVAF